MDWDPTRVWTLIETLSVFALAIYVILAVIAILVRMAIWVVDRLLDWLDS